MGRKYKPPRYAKPWKRERDEELEQKILQDLAASKEANEKRMREKEVKEK